MPLKPSEPPHLLPSTKSDTGAFGAFVGSHALDEPRDGPGALLELVDDVLRIEERDALAVDRTGERHQLIELIVLTPEPEDEHRAGVGMPEQAGEHVLSVL